MRHLANLDFQFESAGPSPAGAQQARNAEVEEATCDISRHVNEGPRATHESTVALSPRPKVSGTELAIHIQCLAAF